MIQTIIDNTRLQPATAEKMVSRSVIFIVPHLYSQAQVKKLIISEGSYEAIRNHRGTINRIFTICSGALNLFLSPRTVKYPSSSGFCSEFLTPDNYKIKNNLQLMLGVRGERRQQ